MQVHGEFKMQAHIIRIVVVDIAAFKVCHSVGTDKDATALRAARARSSSTSIGAMEEISRTVERRAHIVSLIRVDVGVGQRRRAYHIKSTTLPGKASARNLPSGRWMKV